VGVKIEENNNTAIALLEGDIDHHTASEMREKIDDFIQENHPSVLYLDFNKINFMDSSGIGLIMGRFRLMKLFGGRVEVINASKSLERIFKLSGLGALGVLK